MSKIVSLKKNPYFSSMLFSENYINYLQESVTDQSSDIIFDEKFKVECISGKLSYCLAFLELLTYCAYDQNPIVEAICQSVVSLHNILMLLGQPKCHILTKLEMARF